jgi:hypothetical protein
MLFDAAAGTPGGAASTNSGVHATLGRPSQWLAAGAIVCMCLQPQLCSVCPTASECLPLIGVFVRHAVI